MERERERESDRERPSATEKEREGKRQREIDSKQGNGVAHRIIVIASLSMIVHLLVYM